MLSRPPKASVNSSLMQGKTMSNILLITSSPRGDESVSNKFSGELANKLKAKSASNTLVHRDLAADPIPHLDTVKTAAIRKAPDQRTV